MSRQPNRSAMRLLLFTAVTFLSLFVFSRSFIANSGKLWQVYCTLESCFLTINFTN